MSNNRIWVLGASDPEMAEIEQLLRVRGERVEYATVCGQRVRPSEAYSADCAIGAGVTGLDVAAYTVECRPYALYGSETAGIDWAGVVVEIDHHHPGDAGFGRPAAGFWAASSIGQVCAVLGVEPTAELLLVAAADHCLGAAYRGECPGVDPDALMAWRVESRATFQGVDKATLLANVESAKAEILAAPTVCLMSVGDMPHTTDHDWSRSVCDGCNQDPVYVRDMRRETPISELPEAAARLGEAYISGTLVGSDGRRKYTCSGGAAVVEAFFVWAENNDLVDAYGDPTRGFAGAYAE